MAQSINLVEPKYADCGRLDYIYNYMYYNNVDCKPLNRVYAINAKFRF